MYCFREDLFAHQKAVGLVMNLSPHPNHNSNTNPNPTLTPKILIS